VNPDRSLFVAANHGHQDNTRRLLEGFGRHIPSIALDSGSQLTPEERRLFEVAMPNVYYSGLFNEAVAQARRRAGTELLFFFCSDVEVADPGRVVARALRAFEDPRTGVWAPVATGNAHPQCRPRRLPRFRPRQVAFVEGFCFVARLSLLEQMTPVDLAVNSHGWGLDVHLGYLAVANGMRTLADDAVRVHHPKSTGYGIDVAREQRNAWYRTLSPAARRFRAIFGFRPSHWPPCLFFLKRGWRLR